MAGHPVIVISPHLDDAVFSVGQTLAAHPESVVATVFAGIPDPGTAVSGYERSAGFASSIDSVMARRDEDIAACQSLDCIAYHGSFHDRPHRRQPVRRSALRDWMLNMFDGFDQILIPLGIHHPDHLLVASVALEAATATSAEILVYEELPYRVQYPQASVTRARAYTNTAFETECGPEKRAAVECYASQLSDTIRNCVFVPERVWRLA